MVSVVTGPSGAGKSSLLNALQPGLVLRTGEISERRTGRGRAHHGLRGDDPARRGRGTWWTRRGSAMSGSGASNRAGLSQCFPDLAPGVDAVPLSRLLPSHGARCPCGTAPSPGEVEADRGTRATGCCWMSWTACRRSGSELRGLGRVAPTGPPSTGYFRPASAGGMSGSPSGGGQQAGPVEALLPVLPAGASRRRVARATVSRAVEHGICSPTAT